MLYVTKVELGYSSKLAIKMRENDSTPKSQKTFHLWTSTKVEVYGFLINSSLITSESYKLHTHIWQYDTDQ